MVILSNGYKLPEDGDFGDVWFPALEDNIQRLNDHNHDGVNSELLPSTSFTSTHETVSSAGFAASGSGFRALVTMPVGLNYDDFMINVRDPSTGDQVFLSTERVSPTQYYLYANLVQDYEVYYLT